MSLREHWRLVSDIRTVARTLTKANGLATGYRRDFEPGEITRDVDRLHAAKAAVRVAEARWETPDVKTLRLVGSHGPLPPFLPGQYVKLAMEIDGVRTSRPLSISSLPSQPGIEVTVKRKPNGFVSPYLVDRVVTGDRLALSGPAGDFHFNPLRDTEELIAIAAGSGIAPLAGIIEHLLATRPGAQARLIYGSRNEEQIIFRERLERLRGEYPQRFELLHTLSQPSTEWSGERGRIDAGLLRRELSEISLAGKTFFLCGPSGMTGTAVGELQAMGVRSSRIQVEAFGGPADVTEAEGWPATTDGDHEVTIELGAGGKKITGRSGESLMVALERAGYAVASSCRTGACASCRCKLVAGEVFTAAGALLRDTDRDTGIVHTCATYPLGDVVLEMSDERRG